ncbi:MAG: ImmA/IrrE family metallo-endopeptidase [Candidatus Aminicenantes bacterium]|nr:ImmA/IrrE family metallo-endopeptidase [Candidatus Aminicenantes bacterium]
MKSLLGRRLRQLREEAGLSQSDLARSVGLSPEHIWNLEHGTRMPSLESLTRLADFFRKDVSFFLAEKEAAFSLLLKEKSLDRRLRSYLRNFKEYAEIYLRLEELTGQKATPAPLYQTPSATQLAREERQRLQLGTDPLADVFSLFEINGLHLVRQALGKDSQIVGIFIFFDQEQAAFGLVNASLPEEDQAIIAAHLYGHYLKDRYAGPIIDNSDIFLDYYLSLYHPREKFAQEFALSFLWPPTRLKECLQREIKKPILHFEDILYLHRVFKISVKALLSLLYRQEVISPTRYKTFMKFNSDEGERLCFKNLFSLNKKRLKKGQIIHSDRFCHLVIEALRKKKLTTEEAATLLQTNVNELADWLAT